MTGGNLELTVLKYMHINGIYLLVFMMTCAVCAALVTIES